MLSSLGRIHIEEWLSPLQAYTVVFGIESTHSRIFSTRQSRNEKDNQNGNLKIWKHDHNMQNLFVVTWLSQKQQYKSGRIAVA